jgi:glycosyltransferase involved in cell wall biosynthesis
MQKILTISIPTWNRASLLQKLLSQVTQEISELKLDADIELLISNNDSSDTTEEVVKGLMGKYNFITYNRNETNIGGKSNVLKSMQLAGTPYVMFFGDDDNFSVERLIPVIDGLKRNSNIGVLLDTSFSKFQYEEEQKIIDASELARNFFWYMGNAGCFIMRTEYLKRYLTEYGYDFFNECWPQTQLMLTGLCNNKGHCVVAGNFGVSKESAHTDVMIYSSFYLWRTVVYDLRISLEGIRHLIPEDVYRSARNSLNKNAAQNFLNLLQCGVFVDEKSIREKTVGHIRKSFQMFSVKEKALYGLVALVLSLPVFISKPFSDLFIYLTRGKKGLDRKNTFVEKEISKKKGKLNSDAVRTLEFEKK